MTIPEDAGRDETGRTSNDRKSSDIRDRVRNLLFRQEVETLLTEPWDCVIAFPPCTYLSNVGNRWKSDSARIQSIQTAQDFFMLFANLNCPRVAIENPAGIMSREWRKPDQVIYPYQFGHPWSKRTCLWLKGLPLLKPTKWVGNHGPWVGQTDRSDAAHRELKRQGLQTYQVDIARMRSRTFQGIADAMAEQWG